MVLRPTTATAAGLLVILVVHLAYMASPLHAMMVTEHPDAQVMTHGDVEGRAVEATSVDDHERDCAIEWSRPTQSVSLVTPLVPLVGTIAGLFADQPQAPPMVRALGPPQRCDSQALLQVFRE